MEDEKNSTKGQRGWLVLNSAGKQVMWHPVTTSPSMRVSGGITEALSWQ